MQRIALLLPLGLTSGLLVGLIAGGLVLNLILGRDPNATGIFVLIAEFPGFARLTSVPWVLPWQIVGASTVLFTIAAVALTFRQQLTEYGQAKFQARAEMKANGLLQPLGAGMVFGKLGAPSKTAPYVSATFQKFPHCLVVAPTRAGKGVGYVIPNTLLFNGSIVVLDVKGEIFEATSRHRQAEGDAVYRFSPFDFEHPTHRYNPLERVARIENLEQRYTELAKISDYFLTVSDKGTAGDFLTEGRELFVAAGLLAIERGKPTIGEISRILFGRGATQEVYGEHAEEVKHPNAAQTFRKFAGYSDRTLSSHASVLGGAGMTLWNNPAVDRATSGNDFSFADLRKRPMSIYVVVNADDIRTLSPLVRLFFGELIATMRSTLPDPKTEPWPVMVMLDEFDQLGPMPIVEQALKQLAGHGARVSIITQSIPGLDNIYGENVRLSLEFRRRHEALPRGQRQEDGGGDFGRIGQDNEAFGLGQRFAGPGFHAAAVGQSADGGAAAADPGRGAAVEPGSGNPHPGTAEPALGPPDRLFPGPDIQEAVRCPEGCPALSAKGSCGRAGPDPKDGGAGTTDGRKDAGGFCAAGESED